VRGHEAALFDQVEEGTGLGCSIEDSGRRAARRAARIVLAQARGPELQRPMSMGPARARRLRRLLQRIASRSDRRAAARGG